MIFLCKFAQALWQVKTAAIVLDGEMELMIALLQLQVDLRGLSVLTGIAQSFLSNPKNAD